MSWTGQLWRATLLRRHPELAGLDAAALPEAVWAEYRVTFGQDHRGRRMPCGCEVDPAGWLAVVAEPGVPVGQVAEVVFGGLGAGWASMYAMGVEQSPGPPAEPGYLVDWARFPRGELHRIVIDKRS